MFKVLLKYPTKLILLSGGKNYIYINGNNEEIRLRKKKHTMNDIYNSNNPRCKHVAEEYILWDIYIISFFVKQI